MLARLIALSNLFWQLKRCTFSSEKIKLISTLFIFYNLRKDCYYKINIPFFSLCLVVLSLSISQHPVERYTEVYENLFDPATRLCLAQGRHYVPRAFRLSIESRCDRNDMYLVITISQPSLGHTAIAFCNFVPGRPPQKYPSLQRPNVI